MRILMVSPYPPIRDGIGSYAVQEVAALIERGDDVEVLSPWPSAAHHHLDLRSRRGPFALGKRVHRYDKVIVQYHPDVFYPMPLSRRDRLVVTLGLVFAFARARDLEVRVHELNYAWGRRSSPFGWLFRLLWRMPNTITLHTAHERDLLARSTGRSKARIEVTDHGRHFIRRAALSRHEARTRLGLDESSFTFLAIGFIQPHKGFDRAVRAFGDLADAGCRIDIVGSVRVDEPEFLAYAGDLTGLVAATRGAHLHDGYVSDELFDVWLVAADVLVLPYRHIWSSSVLERAAIYGTRVIATEVGGLGGQASADVQIIPNDDDALARAMRDAVGIVQTPRDPFAWPAVTADNPDRTAIMDAIRARAETFGNGRVSRGAGGTLRVATGAIDELPPLHAPQPLSADPFARFVKRVVRRVTAWEIDPIVQQLNAVQRATANALSDREADVAPDRVADELPRSADDVTGS